MAQINGKLVICDRCGATTFRKCAGEGEADGGFTRWNVFEPLEDGWKSRYEIGMLCPECNEKYESIQNAFMMEKQAFMQEKKVKEG